MLSYIFHIVLAFAKYTAITLYMLSIFLFIIYGVAFVEAWQNGLIK